MKAKNLDLSKLNRRQQTALYNALGLALKGQAQSTRKKRVKRAKVKGTYDPVAWLAEKRKTSIQSMRTSTYAFKNGSEAPSRIVEFADGTSWQAVGRQIFMHRA